MRLLIGRASEIRRARDISIWNVEHLPTVDSTLIQWTGGSSSPLPEALGFVR